MGFEFYKESYTGNIREITVGSGDKAVTVGGETGYPFYQFEGDMPNKPRIAMEVWDMAPEDWAEAALAPYKDVVSDPAAWAKKCVNDYGAELIVLQLKSIDPNGQNTGAVQAAATVKKVAEAIDVPLIVWGCANVEKDEEVLKKIAEECDGMHLTLGPVEDKNHKGIAASAMGFGHAVISSSPIDVNLAKQVNILLENLGMPMDKVLIDPTTGGLGYGMEYSYSVMERLRMAALTQGDGKLQFPIINNLGNEVWKCKEAKQPVDEAPELGDPERRAILMEAVGAVTYLMAGSDILIMRHPEAIRMVKAFIDLAAEGGSAQDVAPIGKQLSEVEVDLAAIAPEPDLSIEEEKAKPAAAAKPAPEKKAAPAAEKKAEAPKPTAEAKPAEAPKPAAEAKPAEPVPAEDTAAKKAEEEAKKKAAQEAKAKAKADAEAKEKAEEDARKKAAADAAAKREAEEEEVRQKRAKEREQRQAKQKTEPKKKAAMTPAEEQASALDKMLDRLDRIHRR